MNINYRGYVLHIPESGGKAGKGRNKTGTVQIRKHNHIIKDFHFKTGDFNYQRKAEDKAKKYIDDLEAF